MAFLYFPFYAGGEKKVGLLLVLKRNCRWGNAKNKLPSQPVDGIASETPGTVYMRQTSKSPNWFPFQGVGTSSVDWISGVPLRFLNYVIVVLYYCTVVTHPPLVTSSSGRATTGIIRARRRRKEWIRPSGKRRSCNWIVETRALVSTDAAPEFAVRFVAFC